MSSAQAHIVADAASRFGSGVIDVTNRANLQIRGVRAGAETALIETLLTTGLGPSHPEADDVRNVLLSPTAGIDPFARVDTRPLAETLLARLQQDFAPAATQDCRRLSPKFSIQLDGGEALAMLGHHHDIWLAAMAAPAPEHLSGEETHDEQWFAIGLAGSPSRLPDDPAPLAACRADRLDDAIATLLTLFLEWTGPDETRMRQLLQRIPAGEVVQAWQARCNAVRGADQTLRQWRRAPVAPERRFGAVSQAPLDAKQDEHTRPALWHLGAQIPLGRIDADALRHVANLATELGDGTLRLTPWQGVLLPNMRNAHIERAGAGLRALGLIDTPTNALGQLIACTGQPDCAKGLADTKNDAKKLASRLPFALDLQLTGCDRGCAAGHRPAYTLLASGIDRYDLYQGAPVEHIGDVAEQVFDQHHAATFTAPTQPSAMGTNSSGNKRFGHRIDVNLSIDAAAKRLTLLSSSDLPLNTHA